MTHTDDFRALGLSDDMLGAVKAKGFEIPTPIQALTIPKLLSQENDIIAQSQTGTGKTAAYGLPIMQELTRGGDAVKAIVLVPTRELALQVTEELISFNHIKKLSIASIYGGASISEQLRRLSKGIDIVVGTPGRVLDHIRRGSLKLDAVRFLILDEADEMLNMGFIEDIEEIMSHTAEDRRVLLFSATMPERIKRLSKNYMRETEVLKVESSQLTTDLTDQIYFEVREGDKFDALTRIIDIQPEFYGIIFSRTKIGVDELVNALLERGYAAEGLHGDVSQAQREKTLRKFKNKKANILVATDVAARGIDINNLTHVINYSLPQDSESYVHRIGRTGRAGNQGTAITFITNSEFRRFTYLKKDIKADIKKEQLPTAQDVVAMKRSRIMDDLQGIVDAGSYAEYGTMAEELLTLYPAEVALGALIRLAFSSQLEENNYPEIRSFSVDRKGTARLFIAIGRKDGYDVPKLVALLKRECGLKDSNINDIKLSENYSFVSVPFVDAEHVIRKLNKIRKGDRPLAEIAEPPGGGGGKERRRSDRGESREGAAERKPRRKSEDSFGDREENTRSSRPARKENGGGGKMTPARPGTRRNAAPDREKPARSSSPKPAAKKKQAGEDFDYGTPDGGFNWSMFEQGGNTWDDRPSKKKKKK